MPRYVITPPAKANLDSIRRYLNRESANGWRIMSRRFRAAFATLAENPHIGFKEPTWTQRGYRFFPVRRYVIAYDPQSRPLTIINVFHSAQDVGRMMHR